jgi:nucleotide-binding universal stress UspA family protein
MTTEDKTVSKSSQKDKEDSTTTLSAETGEDNITKPSGEKKVAVVTPTKGQYNESQVQRQEMERNKEESISDKAKEAAQSFKSLVKPANSKKVIPSVKSHIQTDINLEYNRILVPHDGSEMSDKALNHAIYLSKKLSSEEIVILNVLQHVQSNTSSALVVTSEGEGVEKTKKEELEVSLEGSLKQKIEEKIRLCKDAGVKSQVSFKVQTGQPVDEIVKLSEDMDVDLIVMASSRITSSIKGLGSTTRKVIDKAKRPVLVIHE